MTENDEGSALAALAGMTRWKDSWERLLQERKELVAQAWNGGCTNVAFIARTLGMSRDTVYADLYTSGIDYGKSRWQNKLDALPQETGDE